ncbi:DNA helicase MCM9-like [Diabrotica virgifera virgifera]|uniref:DNA helicase MCM9 n=1 Tax=Diabrotica virgifera virgifera TaxID=50390 RepID=A0ABM5K6X1_DIAVI|nr:DNA helicase MCM9-like [Diabrotica virgifera virgifera]
MSDEYLLLFHKDDLIEILSSKDHTKHYSININFIELYEHDDELARAILNDPDSNIEAWDNAAVRTQMSLLKELDKKVEIKPNVHCRIFHLAHLAWKSAFPGARDEGTFLQISGTVMRITAAKLLEYQRSYVCVTCKRSTLVKADYGRKYMIKQPTHCKNPEGCPGTNLVHFGDIDSENCKDYQEIKIQEQVKKLGLGSVPSTMWVTLEDDLVDCCQPGDDVTICGILKKRYGEFCVGKRTEVDLVFKANHIQVDSHSFVHISNPESDNIFNNFWEQYKDDPLEGRDVILKSICPEIYGLYPVKLAMATVLAGGCSIEDTTATGVRTRSEAHLLLVGDPGTGKSQLLRFASKVVPRAVLTTGIGSTAAGLTVTAKMEQGEWHLEAGALVMADGGICCIDEFNSMKEHDRTTIHEAMEQQTISVAKASMVCKLNTRCSILAACNPKGNIDPTQTMSMNIALPSPLLSRFDLVMLLRDTVNQEWDELVIDYILNGGNISNLTSSSIWPVKNLQAYFKRIKKLQPKLTEDAELILSTYYNIQRRLDSRNKARTTVRLLESLVRISQGHARVMNHEKVQVIDSIYAIFLIDISMDLESSVLNLKTSANSVFPENPKIVYKNLLESILNKLQLENILEKELKVLNITKEQQIQSRFFANQGEDVQNNESCVNKTLRDLVFEPKCSKSAEVSNKIVNSTISKVTKVISESSKKRFEKSNINSFDDILDQCSPIKTIQKTGNSSKESKKADNLNFNDFDLVLNEINKRKSVASSSESNENTRKRKKHTENIIIPEEKASNNKNKAKKSTMFESGFDESAFEEESTEWNTLDSSKRGDTRKLANKKSPNDKKKYSKGTTSKKGDARRQKVNNESSGFDESIFGDNISERTSSDSSKRPSTFKFSSRKSPNDKNESSKVTTSKDGDASRQTVDNEEEPVKKSSNTVVDENIVDREVPKHSDLNKSELGFEDGDETRPKPKKTPPGSLAKFKFVPKEARVDNKATTVTDSCKPSADGGKNAPIEANMTPVKDFPNKAIEPSRENPKNSVGSVQSSKKDQTSRIDFNNEKNIKKKLPKSIFDSNDPISFDDILEDKPDSSKKKTFKFAPKKPRNSRTPFKKEPSKSIENDWDMLKFMPGVNDGFNIDLDIDWDNIGGEKGSGSFGSNASNGLSGKTSRNIFESGDDVDFNI